MIIAHKDNKGNVQSLIEHAMNVANHCKEIGDKISLGEFAYILGLLHDIGKADRRCQHKIINLTNDRVIHSSAGAKFFYHLAEKLYKPNFNNFSNFCEIGAYVISAHHGLYDIFRLDTKK
ncbi:CRISPR-associated endonuclease Cas3-HD [Peptoniphilus olsenii]|uniref:CRISPR-associated endonuclease Cas3-HD n=1 Tax=Peptoniphilus olsenii TaxID=411570 RepID=A0ABV2JA10_9FIRM